MKQSDTGSFRPGNPGRNFFLLLFPDFKSLFPCVRGIRPSVVPDIFRILFGKGQEETYMFPGRCQFTHDDPAPDIGFPVLSCLHECTDIGCFVKRNPFFFDFHQAVLRDFQDCVRHDIPDPVQRKAAGSRKSSQLTERLDSAGPNGLPLKAS